MQFKISVGNSRFDKKWRLMDISLEDFGKRLSQTQRTAESVAEYRKMSKLMQDNIKDVGGFVAGELKNGIRRKSHVLNRSMLSLDMDYASPETIDEIELLQNFHAFVYSTHKHRPESPRLRLMAALKRPVSPDEYQAVARLVAKDIGIELFDDSTYEPVRLMYWPSTSSDGEYIFRELKGELLDPDEYLARYEDWQDVSQWPVSNRQSEIIKTGLTKQADPLIKEGIVGAFCRAYSIEGAIEKFLPDVYQASAIPGRYDYKAADSQAGLVIYDSKYAYSHHASDPAHGKLLNAFDLVRLHKYAELDELKGEILEGSKLPSFKAMSEFASQDEAVKLSLAQDRIKAAEIEFKGGSWQVGLELSKSGAVKDSLRNIEYILKNDERLSGIRYNRHSNSVHASEELPWEQLKRGWSDSDQANLRLYFNKNYDIDAPGRLKDALIAVASQRAFHPIADYLNDLPKWDGQERLDSLLIEYFGAEDNEYVRAVTRKTLTAAVARIYRPGIKFDQVLILNGPQGIGKSTFFDRLAGEWFSDALNLNDMKDKSGAEKLQGYWILELSELTGMRKAETEAVKSFISRREDKYRPAYGINVENRPRQCIIVGSTNAEDGFLRDVTGNRRFWPVKVSGNSAKKAWQLMEDEVRQIWAEAKEAYINGEKLQLEARLIRSAQEAQEEAMELDEREGLVQKYLETKLPKNWDNLSMYERRNWLNSQDEDEGTEERQEVCNMEIWCECFGKSPETLTKADSYAINAMLNKLGGWENTKERRYFSIYGRQRFFKRLI